MASHVAGARSRASRHGRRTPLQTSIARWCDIALEATWLLAAVIVPLIVLSEHQFLDFTALPKTVALRTLAGIAAALLLARGALTVTGNRWEPDVSALFLRFRSFSLTPRTAIIAAATATALATALSTAVSIWPAASLWGREAGRDSFSLYSTLSYLVLFAAIALRLRTRGQAIRLWGAIAATAVIAAVIGTAQHYGFAPLGIGTTMFTRVTGPSGNPIFFGALLLIGFPFAMMAAVAATARLPRWQSWAVVLAVAYCLVLALTWTVARGAWLGFVITVPVLVVALWYAAGRRAALTTAAITFAAALLVLATIARPSLSIGSWFNSTAAADKSSAGLSPDGAAAQSAGPSSDNLIFSTHIAGEEGLASARSRLELAQISASLALERPEVPHGQSAPWIVRALAGYGPDTYQYAFQRVAPASQLERLTSAAHSDPLNRLVETGVLGLAAWLSLIAGAGWMAINALRSAGRGRGGLRSMIAAALVAALAGRFVEQLFGIPQAGDTLTFWLLLGLAASLPVVFSATHAREGTTLAARGQPTTLAVSWRRAPALAAAAAMLVLAVLAGALTWSKNVNYLEADAHAATAVRSAKTDPATAIAAAQAAESLAPDVAEYQTLNAALLRLLALGAQSSDDALALFRAAYEYDLAAVAINPLSRDPGFAAGYGAWELAKAGDAGRALDAILHYERLDETMPNHPLVQPRLDQLYRAVKVTPVTAQQ
jgi:hypothetical protein